MIRRLWLGITWPSAVLTLIFGPWLLYLYGSFPLWLLVKLCFVLGVLPFGAGAAGNKKAGAKAPAAP